MAEARKIISARKLQKLAKNDSPGFIDILKVTNDSPSEMCINRGIIPQNNAVGFTATHNKMKGQKRQINKNTGPKKDISSMKEQE